MSRHFHYNGDVNIEHGGTYYALDTFKYDYVDAVRVTPCSDAGGPDNVFWVETVTIILRDPDSEQAKRALDSCGPGLDEYNKLSKSHRRHALTLALLSYGCYDKVEYFNDLQGNPNPVVQVGPKQGHASKEFGSVKVEVVLKDRPNALRNYVRAMCRKL